MREGQEIPYQMVDFVVGRRVIVEEKQCLQQVFAILLSAHIDSNQR